MNGYLQKEVMMRIVDNESSLSEYIYSGGSVNTRDMFNISLLMYAIQKHSIECVNFLLSHNVDVNETDDVGTTALMMCCYVDDVILTKILINAGADINTPETVYGLTALTISILRKQYHIAKMLLEHGADPYKKDSCIGRTAYEWAKISGCNQEILLAV